VLDCQGTHVADLTPLKGLPLKDLFFFLSDVEDVSPLAGMQLENVGLTPQRVRTGLESLRQMPSLKQVLLNWGPENTMTPEQFWKRYDAGEFRP